MTALNMNIPTEQETETAQTAVEQFRSLVPTQAPTVARFRSAAGTEEVEVVLPGEALHGLDLPRAFGTGAGPHGTRRRSF